MLACLAALPADAEQTSGSATAPASTPAAGGYGHVEFANSGAPAAQADFLAGLALLHDFEYASAADAFRRAQTADPGFAMAYWGEALTFNHPIWMQQDREAARAALARLARTAGERRARAGTERERSYLDAVEILYGDGSKKDRDDRYAAAMGALHRRFPDDVDAAAFYGLSILGTAHAGRDTATYMRAAGVLEEAWIDHHEHPGLLHYLIHSYDDPTHAPLGLRAARIYARVAPDAAHAQHMTSHIFLALGMWPETVSANLAAIADVDRGRRAAGRHPLGCGHYPSWLAYAYLQLGQLDHARTALAACRDELDADRSSSPLEGHAVDPDDSIAGSYANMRLRYLIDGGTWDDATVGWLPPAGAGAATRVDAAFADALAALAADRRGDAQQALAALEAAGQEVAQLEVVRENPDPTYRTRPAVLALEVRSWLAEREGDLAASEQLLRQAVALEDTLPLAFGPPTVDKPSHEALGELLLRQGRRAEARSELARALARTPGRRLAVEALKASQ